MKKILFALTVIFTTLLSFGCEEKDETITIWAWNNNVAILADAVERYQDQVDPNFKAEIVDFSKADINTKISTAATIKNSDDIADIILGDWIYMRSNYELYPELFADLSNDVSDIELEAFPEFSVDVVKNDDGNLFALPFGIGPTVTFAYVPLFEEIGYTRSDLEEIQLNGWTWKEYSDFGESLNEINSEYYMSAYNLSGDDRLFRTMSSQKGFWFMDQFNEVTVGNQVSVDALNNIKEMHDLGILGHVDSGDYKSLMIDGKIAAQIQGFWLSGQLKSLAPEQARDWMILPCPSWNSSEAGDSVTGGSYLYVNDSSDMKAEAIAFIKWQTMNPDNVLRTLEVGGIFPVLKEAYNGDNFIATDNFFGEHNYLLDVANIVTSAKPIYPTKYNQFNYDTYISAQHNVLFENKETVDELSKAATLMKENIDEE